MSRRPRDRQASWGRRAGVPVAVAVVVAVEGPLVAAGAAGLGRLVAQDSAGTSSATAGSPSVPSVTPAAPARSTRTATRPLAVSGVGVGRQRFGAGADAVVAAVSARLGEPDATGTPQRYVRIAGADGWFEDGGDPISPSWRHRFTSVTCWDVLCLVFGGADRKGLRLRGWVLAERGGAGVEQPLHPVDVHLAGTGLRLGDRRERGTPGLPWDGRRGRGGRLGHCPRDPLARGVRRGRRLAALGCVGLHPSGTGACRCPGDPALRGEGPEPGCC